MNGNTFRYAGEFEEQRAVILGWPRIVEPVKGMFTEGVMHDVVKNLIDHVETLVINCGWPGTYERCREILAEGGIDLDRITFTQIPDMMHWMRDYGPDIMVDDEGKMRLVHFRFDMYGMGEEDSEMSQLCRKFAPHMAVELGCFGIEESCLISEGGDKEFNGAGVMMAIEETEVAKRNGAMTKEEVEAEFKRVFNLEKIIWLPQCHWEEEPSTLGVLDWVDGTPVYRSGSANGHIDELARFVDERTVLLLEVSDEEAQELESARITKERCDRAFEVLSQETDAQGRPLRILRIPAPIPEYVVTTPEDWTNRTWGKRFAENEEALLDDGTPMPEGTIVMQPAMSYINYLVCNDVVIAQCYWKEGKPDDIKKRDEEAMNVLREAYPGRTVVPIYSMDLNIRGGGIHCATKNIQK
ncbi:agmatine deiminase family protein [Adlercreutzia sp. R25]|uniref:Agmatine deiminase family protein n=1 Tax=Adlercreutzia shanghongiae TaxID=3111773 RepID=A0ABU6J1E8_9ACTN|nr:MULTISPECIES: agmatine deiminase family protein [unclassified Adlercreutzia]MEC4273513.1 agmatine deiminase family protein [Adlercreutzia sp. R25]MEC4295956.1 agmatine deiminase family protein [Adlercreutzia sp. R22]